MRVVGKGVQQAIVIRGSELILTFVTVSVYCCPPIIVQLLLLLRC